MNRPLDALAQFLEDEGDRSQELRQVSPFAGVLDARERWTILRSLRAS